MAKKMSKDKDMYTKHPGTGFPENLMGDLDLDTSNWHAETYLIGGSNPDKSPFNDHDFKSLSSLSKEFMSGGDLQEG